jgi:hypothetical protein
VKKVITCIDVMLMYITSQLRKKLPILLTLTWLKSGKMMMSGVG